MGNGHKWWAPEVGEWRSRVAGGGSKWWAAQANGGHQRQLKLKAAEANSGQWT